MDKKYQLKVYSIDGTYIKTFSPKQIIGDIRYSEKINGGQGEANVDLNLPIDDFDEGNSIDYMNFVRIYEIDVENSPTPRLIYTGFITQYVPFVKNATQGVRIVLLGLASLLSFAYYKNGSNFTVSHSTDDPADIMKAVIDHFNTQYVGAWIGYDAGNVVDVGSTVTYDFVDQKWFDSLKKAYELSGENRWWMVREDGQLWFKENPSTATHRFTLGKDVDSAEIKKNSEPVVNEFQLRYNDPVQTTTFSDATSKTKYGLREKVQNDARITTTTTRDNRGNQEIEDNKAAKLTGKLVINSNYDIESIRPGDTCSVFNVEKGSAVLPENLLITGISYTPDSVTLQLEDRQDTFIDKFDQAVSRNL